MAQLLDQYGDPIDMDALRREVAGATITGVRQIQSGHPSIGLNPGRLGALLREAETGDPVAYLELAEDLEEKDTRYRSVLASRKLAVSRMEITVIAAGDGEPYQTDADFVRDWLNRSILRKELRDMLDAIGKGYSVTEIMWNLSGDLWLPRELQWRDPRWFRHDRIDGQTLRLLDAGGQELPLPPYKFIYHTSSSKSGLPIRGGLARAVAWLAMFKSFGIKDWVIFLEAYGQPLRVGKYDNGATPEEKATLLKAVRSIASDAGAIIPESMSIDFVDAMTQGQPMHAGFVQWVNTEISILVLGQNLSTEVKGGSLAAAEAHGATKEEICSADGEDLATTLDADLVRPLIDLNRGQRDRYPTLKIAYPEEEQDLGEFMDNVGKFVQLGGRVGASVVRDKMGLPDPAPEDELLQPRAAPAAPADPAAPIAPPAPVRLRDVKKAAAAQEITTPATPAGDTVAKISAQLADTVGPAVDSMIDRLKELVNDPSISTIEDLSDRLLEAYPGMNPNEIAAAIADALLTAHLAGMDEITEDPTVTNG